MTSTQSTKKTVSSYTTNEIIFNLLKRVSELEYSMSMLSGITSSLVAKTPGTWDPVPVESEPEEGETPAIVKGYILTVDVEIDTSKTYYEEQGGSLVEVLNPDVNNIATYYELFELFIDATITTGAQAAAAGAYEIDTIGTIPNVYVLANDQSTAAEYYVIKAEDPEVKGMFDSTKGIAYISVDNESTPPNAAVDFKAIELTLTNSEIIEVAEDMIINFNPSHALEDDVQATKENISYPSEWSATLTVKNGTVTEETAFDIKDVLSITSEGVITFAFKAPVKIDPASETYVATINIISGKKDQPPS